MVVIHIANEIAGVFVDHKVEFAQIGVQCEKARVVDRGNAHSPFVQIIEQQRETVRTDGYERGKETPDRRWRVTPGV